MNSFKLMLAPMEGYTDNDFRQKCFDNGADLTFTEMARISALIRNNKSTLKKIDITNQVPTYIQLIGSNETELNLFLNNFKPKNGFRGFNLNLGCPSSDMLQRGYGAALIKRIAKVKKLVEVIKNHGYSVSIKLRLGLNNFEKQKKVYLKIINEVDANFFIVHARHAKETSKDPADFKVYEECVKTNKVIIANGGINNQEQIDYLKSIGVSGAMIGVFAIKNPQIFSQLKK